MAYMQLHDNPEAEARKGLLTGAVVSTAARASTERRRRWGAEGVGEVAGDVVEEELLGGSDIPPLSKCGQT
jgi:hypothetical protein